jgi:hypothetical protein
MEKNKTLQFVVNKISRLDKLYLENLFKTIDVEKSRIPNVIIAKGAINPDLRKKKTYGNENNTHKIDNLFLVLNLSEKTYDC